MVTLLSSPHCVPSRLFSEGSVAGVAVAGRFSLDGDIERGVSTDAVLPAPSTALATINLASPSRPITTPTDDTTVNVTVSWPWAAPALREETAGPRSCALLLGAKKRSRLAEAETTVADLGKCTNDSRDEWRCRQKLAADVRLDGQSAGNDG